MIEAKKALVYPYNMSFAALLRQLHNKGGYSVVSAVTVGKWYEEGTDAAFLDEGPYIGVPLKHDLMEEILSVDTVIWAHQDYSNNYELFSIVKKTMMTVLEKKKEIICCQPLSHEDKELFEEYAIAHNSRFHYVLTAPIDDVFQYGALSDSEIDVPVIVVSGIFNHCQVMDVVFHLSNLLNADNYKISVIAPSQSATLVGCHSFFCLFDLNDWSVKRKIVWIRETMRNIQDTEKPDAIIVGLPNNLLMFNDKYPGDYGLSAYEFFHAIQPDVSVVCVDCDSYSPEFEERLLNIMKYRYGVDVDAICVSNIGVNRDSLELDLFNVPEYNIYSLSDVMRKIKRVGNIEVFPIIDSHSVYMLEQKIIGLLS